MHPHGDQPLVTAGTPLGDGTKAAVIMVHGRGAAPANILDLVPKLNRSGVSYLAPGASGKTWYPYSFMAETSTNEPGLSSGLHVLEQLVAEVMAKGIPSERLVLLGFSQGACLTSEFAVRHAARYGGVIVFSGALIGAPGTTWTYPGSFGGTPVFLGCSDTDSHVPKARVDESAVVFTRMGAAVTERFYPGMGHLINEDEIAAAQAILDQVMLKTGSGILT